MKKFFKLFIIVIFLMQFPVYAFAEESTAESLANTITFSQDELNSRFSTGTGHSAFIDNNHNLWTWGYNWNGELGYGDRNEPDSIWPRKSISNVKAVSSGDRCTGVIKSDGSLYTFGINDYGQLGNGSSGKYNYSDALNNKVLTNVKQVSMGEYHSVAVTNDGQLYAWGLNNFGQLGKGTTDETKDDLYPTPVFSNVKYAYAGDRCTAVITNDNSLYMFGVNFHGRCGIGNQEFSAVPVKILDNVKSVSLGSSHSAAVTNDGNLYTWGSSYEYELCDGPSNERATNIPGKVMSNVKEVACGASFTVVLLNDGSVLTCGDNFNGKCGTGTDDYTIKKPTKILDGMTHILANNMHALSVGDDGSLWTWGQDLGVSHEHYYSDNGSYSPYRLIKGFKPFSSSWKEPSETKTFKVKTEVNPLGADKYITGDREYKYHETAAVSSNNIIRKFIGWYDGDVLVSKNSLYLFVVTEDVNLTAKYEPIESDLHPPLNGISFETTNLNLEIGQTSQLKVNYDPENAENKTLSWFSTNNSVATVKDGIVKGVGYGSAIIRAQSKDGNHIAECTVNVTIATPNPGISKDPNPNILYESHIENIGWGNFGKDGSSSGTTGRCLRLEGIKINLFGNSNLNIEYQTHVQDIGWMNYVRNGEMSGTEGQAKRLEAIRIKLTGSDAEKFDVCYRVHAQDVGWMNWAKNDQAAGTAGFARRLEAIQIVIVPKGSQPPVLNPSNNTDAAFIQK